MDSVLKIIIGIIIGAVGFWILQPQGEVDGADTTLSNNGSSSEVQSEEKEQKQQLAVKSIPDEDKELNNKLLEKDKHLSPKNNPKGIVLGKKSRSQSSTPPPEQIKDNNTSQEKEPTDKYLEGIPEDYHKLLNPPERRKDLPELHRDLINEEQDLNWGLGMEQQIKSFVMNHPHSNYLLDFRVTCKTTMCEMMSKVPVEHIKKWNDLCNEMIKEGWWEFTGMSASTNYTEDKKNYISVRLMTRTKKD